jgi:hypothetical protein
MEQEAEKLLEEISHLNNVYGFTARHYIKKDTALTFIISFHRAVSEGLHVQDQDLKDRVMDFAIRYNEMNQKLEKQ